MLINRLIDYMFKYKAIDTHIDQDIYIYGLKNGLFLLLNLLTGLFLALYLKRTVLFLILMMCFIPLRSYCGGFHCNSRLNCYMFSNILIYIILQAQNSLIKIIPCIFIITVACGVYIWKNALNHRESQRMDIKEIVHYDKVKRKIICLLFVLIFILLLLKLYICATTVMSSVILTTILFIISQIKVKIIKGHEKLN